MELMVKGNKSLEYPSMGPLKRGQRFVKPYYDKSKCIGVRPEAEVVEEKEEEEEEEDNERVERRNNINYSNFILQLFRVGKKFLIDSDNSGILDTGKKYTSFIKVSSSHSSANTKVHSFLGFGLSADD
ncbi:hypothetical protein M0802_007400 [Mischocyttarus mexicanus]|nr:hypothetical protein M0802_007400 [Mischocyttarus mexicanus]